MTRQPIDSKTSEPQRADNQGGKQLDSGEPDARLESRGEDDRDMAIISAMIGAARDWH